MQWCPKTSKHLTKILESMLFLYLYVKSKKQKGKTVIKRSTLLSLIQKGDFVFKIKCLTLYKLSPVSHGSTNLFFASSSVKIYRKLAYWKSKVIKFVWKTVFSAFLKLFIYNYFTQSSIHHWELVHSWLLRLWMWSMIYHNFLYILLSIHIYIIYFILKYF